MLVCQVGPKYIEENLAAVKVLGSDVGLALGGMGDVALYSRRAFLYTSLRDVPDKVRYLELYMLTFGITPFSIQ